MKLLTRSKINIKNLVMVNGRILIKKSKDNKGLYEVIDVAPNVNYEGLKEKIKVGDTVITSEYLYSNNFKVKEQEYWIIKANQILGMFKNQ